MERAEGWYICRAGFVETIRAVGIAAGARATRALWNEWPVFSVLQVDQPLVEHAAALALDRDLRSLDSLHLAAALVLPREDLVFATWDRRLHAAAADEGAAAVNPRGRCRRSSTTGRARSRAKRRGRSPPRPGLR
jgi:predicted nucleic acid-binding protein